MKDNEKGLIERAQGGDKMAFQEIMKIHGQKMLGLAFKFTKNHQDAEDLYQETFLKIYRNLNSFRFESEFTTWAYRILANIAYNTFRKQKNSQTVDMQDGERDLWETIPGDEKDQADREVYNEALREQIHGALSQLSPKQKTVFIMKHYEGKKIKDIAGILGTTEGTVKKYLFRATQKMRQSLVNA
ncbi:MAG: RNA polymerase sigma factor [Candidatus Marinimicrobia bacterium]|nr:RNA polymerase sigma factor [Candidatus Neomarinimicrobiota bacterium]